MSGLIIASVLISVAIGTLLLLRRSFGGLPLLWLKNENVFVDPNNSSSVQQFPTISKQKNSSYKPYLSVIIPAYNEEERLPIMLDEALDYMKERQSKDKTFTWEIIVVDDGSKDKTTQISLDYSAKETTDRFRVLTLAMNRGKGGAVKRGVICSRGDYVLMADADGATKFADIIRLENDMKKVEKNGLGFVVGSRAHLAEEAVAKRTPFRNLLMYGLHTLLHILGVRNIKDTQCGFKLFSRESARLLFPNLHIERWAFDIELIYMAQQLGIPMAEVAVNWTEIPGSKLNPLAASIQIGKDLFRIRLGHMLGFWGIDTHFNE